MLLKNILKIALIPVILTLGACDKFLDETPKGVVIPETLEDFEALMSSSGLVNTSPRGSNYISDEIILPESQRGAAMGFPGRNTVNAYDMLPEHYDISENDPDWNNAYRAIYVYNSVLQGLEQNTETDRNRRNRIKGEALVHRSYSFLALVNLYAKHYSGTANQDLGIPLPLKPDINVLLARETVERVYQQVEQDLLEAINLLPSKPTFSYRPSQGAAYGTLARLYLYQGKWQEAFDNASKALDINNFLYDYNSFSWIDSENKYFGIVGYPSNTLDKKHIIYHKYIQGGTSFDFTFLIDPEFLKRYKVGDLRQEFGTSTKGFGNVLPGVGALEMHGAYDYNNAGITTQEMYLIRAEAAARLNRLPEALQSLNTLRKYRFSPDTYNELISNNQKEVITWVLEERALELAFLAHRLFDIKRLHLLGEDIYITREGKVYAPTHPLLVFPIPAKNIDINKNLIQNPRQ